MILKKGQIIIDQKLDDLLKDSQHPTGKTSLEDVFLRLTTDEEKLL